MAAERRATFAEHIQELRRRLMWSLLFVALGAGIGYVLHDKLLQIMQRPLHDKLYYTNPTGAFSFVIKICTVFGLTVALPMMLYQGFAFFEPLIKVRTRRMIVWYVFVSFVLAMAGITFAYYVSLPAALHFLVNFGGEDIQSLITANEYFNFVLAYIAGFAVLFQLPLIISFINKVTPLTPRKLMGATRYVVLGSFIVAAVITPTPDPFNQALMAGPIILLYFASACVVAFANRGGRRKASEPPQVTIPDELIPEPEPEPMPPPPPPAPTPLPPADPAPPTPRPVQARPQPRLIADMIVPNRKVTVTAYQQRSPQSVRPMRPVVTRPQRLISDFIPAPE